MKTETGFTLIELMVAVAVFAITATFAVPSFMDFIRNNRLAANTNELVASLHVARAEAVKRKVIISVCGSSDSASCNTTSWENGWIVFADVDADGVVDSGVDEIITVQNHIGETNTLRGLNFSNLGRIQYNGRGVVDSTGTFKVCDSRGNKYAKAININVTGRVRLATDDDSSSIVNDSSGSDITCP